MRLQCSTCLDQMSPEEDLGCTPCGHVFHLVCILRWLEHKKNCPQCRSAVEEGSIRKIFLIDIEERSGGGTQASKLREGKVKGRMDKMQADGEYSENKGKRKVKNKPGLTKMWLRRDKKCEIFFFFEGRGLKFTTPVKKSMKTIIEKYARHRGLVIGQLLFQLKGSSQKVDPSKLAGDYKNQKVLVSRV